MSTSRYEKLSLALRDVLGSKLIHLGQHVKEITIVVQSQDLLDVSEVLHDHPNLSFDTLIDLCGVDYASYTHDSFAGEGRQNRRFAVVYHLLSTTLNHRLRLRVFIDDDEFPMIDSVMGIWPSANWFEREAFDLYGIIFQSPRFRRILTDYGLLETLSQGFSLIWFVEMCYDAEQKSDLQPIQ